MTMCFKGLMAVWTILRWVWIRTIFCPRTVPWWVICLRTSRLTASPCGAATSARNRRRTRLCGCLGDGQALREMEDAEPAQEHRVRLDNGSPMEAQWKPNGSLNGSPMEADKTQCFRWCGKDKEV